MGLKQTPIDKNNYIQVMKIGYKVFLKWKNGRLSGVSGKSIHNNYMSNHLIEIKGHRIWFFDSEEQAQEYVNFVNLALMDYYKQLKVELLIRSILYDPADRKMEDYYCDITDKVNLTRNILDGVKNKTCVSTSRIILK